MTNLIKNDTYLPMKMQKRGISVAATALKHPKTYACVQLTVAHSGFAIGPPLWVL